MKLSNKRIGFLFALTLVGGIATGCATSQTGDNTVYIHYPTLDLKSSNPAALDENLASAKSLQGVSYLQLPSTGDAPYPLVLVLPHSGGVDSAVRQEAAFMRQRGWASMIVDPYAPRGVKSIVESPGSVKEASYHYDIHRAMDAVSSRPDIDMTRIAAIGRSWGGSVQIPLQSRWWRDKYRANHDIKAYVIVSPLCWLTERTPKPVPGKTLLILGMRDNWTPPEPCITYAERLHATGSYVEVMKLPKSGHTVLGGRIKSYPRKVYGYCQSEWDSTTFQWHRDGEVYDLRTDYDSWCLSPKEVMVVQGADPHEKQQAWKRIVEFIEANL